MIRTSKEPFPFALPWNEDVVFMIRPGDMIDRGKVEAALAEQAAEAVFDFQLAATFEEAVNELLSDNPDEAGQLLAIAAAEAALEPGEKLPANEAAALSEAREAVRGSWPAYRALMAQAARRNELLPTVAFQRFVTGWQGEDLPEFRKGIDGLLTLGVMSQFPPIVIRAVGFRAYQALYATGEVKNSAPPSPSDESQAPTASDTSAKASSSRPARTVKKKPGKAIRSSRSPRRSSPSLTSGSTADGIAPQV